MQVNEKVADYSKASQAKPPVAGTKQTWRSFRADLLKWERNCTLGEEQKVGMAMLIGLSRNEGLSDQAELGDLNGTFRVGNAKIT